MTVTRDDVQQGLWRWSGWKADQRLVDEMLALVDGYAATGQQAADDSLAQARREAEQIVQSAKDEAAVIQSAVQQTPERPSDGLKLIPAPNVPLEFYRDDDGVVWLRLGIDGVESPEGQERTRKCSTCRGVKSIIRFSRDRNSRGGRKAQCKDCENFNRRANRANKRANSQGVGR